MTAVHRRFLLALCAALALLLATGASAAIVTSHDDQGRQITFDVRAPNVDTEWYASVLRASAHGDEISDVTIRIVPESQIPALCGGEEASACYTGRSAAPRIMISAGKSKILEDTLLHEYGHHLDTYWHVSGVPELNGTQVWWQARGMAALLASHQVAFDYSLGWSHGIGEMFAEDYSYIHTGDRYAITWMSPPDATLKAALFAELGSPTEPLPAAPEVPTVLNRRGTLVPRDRFSIPFGLLGPGRRVALAATVSKPNRKGIRARALLVCNGKVVVSRAFGKSRSKQSFDVHNLGPADCDVRLVSNTGVSLSYTLRLTLAVDGT